MRRSSIFSALMILCAGSMATAENHRFLESPSVQRLGSPQAGANRITSPSAPGGPSRPAAPSAAGAERVVAVAPASPAISGLAPAPSDVDWYWEAISPSLESTDPVTVQTAVAALATAPIGSRVPAPRLQSMTTLADRYGVQILAATMGTDVSPALVLAVISVESAGQSDAVSSAGAQGVMQLMPPTAARFDVDDSFDPRENIRGGTAYLDWLLNEFDDRVIFALAGYNAGEGAVREYNGIPPFAETRAYVPKVLAAWEVARSLCITPPQTVTDSCIFSINLD